MRYAFFFGRMGEIIIKNYIDEQKKSPRCEVKNKEIKSSQSAESVYSRRSYR